jgi:hypothetical protein
VASPAEKPKKYEERLMSTFAFDEDDLAANQAGHLSQKQAIRLKSARNSEIYRLVLPAFVSLLIALGFFRYTASIIVFLTVVAIAILMMLAINGPKLYRWRADLLEEAILSAEGRIYLSLDTRRKKVGYFLRLGGVWLSIDKAKFLALKNGDPYRIYYTRRTKHILAVEWLRDGDDNLIEVASSDDENLFLEVTEKPKRQAQ